MDSTTVCLLFLTLALVEGRMLLPSLFRRGTSCSESELEQCVEPIAQIGQNPIGGYKLENMDDAQALDAICVALDESKKCINSFMSKCYGSEGDVAVQTIEGVLTYMCSDEGRRALIEEQSCWENDELEGKLNECVEVMQNQAFAIAMGGGETEDICPVFDELRECAKSKIQSLCNSQLAVNFIDKLLYYSLKEAGSQIGCDVKLRLTRDLYTLFQKARK